MPSEQTNIDPKYKTDPENMDFRDGQWHYRVGKFGAWMSEEWVTACAPATFDPLPKDREVAWSEIIKEVERMRKHEPELYKTLHAKFKKMENQMKWALKNNNKGTADAISEEQDAFIMMICRIKNQNAHLKNLNSINKELITLNNILLDK
jgi:hypothetical protein